MVTIYNVVSFKNATFSFNEQIKSKFPVSWFFPSVCAFDVNTFSDINTFSDVNAFSGYVGVEHGEAKLLDLARDRKLWIQMVRYCTKNDAEDSGD